MSNKYQLGKIYKIVCLTTNNCYIGSTCEPTLARRLASHRSNYRAWVAGKAHFTTSFTILKEDNYDIVLIESFPCNSKDELHARERYWTNNIPCINKNKNQGIIAELGEKEYKKQHTKLYRANNKEKIAESTKEQTKIYRANNKEKISEYAKEYYELNKESNKIKRSEKHTCECGCTYTKPNKALHFRSKNHQAYVAQLETNIIN